MPRVDVRDRKSLEASKKRSVRKRSALKRQINKLTALIHRREKQIKALPKDGQRQRAVKFALTLVGRHEDAGRPNRAAWLDRWARDIGEWMVAQPWCGLACWIIARHVGVQLTTETVSTVAIRNHARNGTGGYKRWLTPSQLDQMRPGDFVIMGFKGAAGGPMHVGIYLGGGKIGEGNTSPGKSGSQNNGGGYFIRTVAERRPFILGVAVPNYSS